MEEMGVEKRRYQYQLFFLYNTESHVNVGNPISKEYDIEMISV